MASAAFGTWSVRDRPATRVTAATARLLFVCVIGISIVGCHRTRLYTLEEVGCGAGAYAGQPVQRRAARWPELMLGVTQHAALHEAATDVATGRAAVILAHAHHEANVL
jgi:hypothetical protein